ncbi:hypothetical protein C8R46DRAFT_292469 [Mycena filopes]|nr:hypothetical protein C8R46DRAFT_292469 [Mycena filopes]
MRNLQAMRSLHWNSCSDARPPCTQSTCVRQAAQARRGLDYKRSIFLASRHMCASPTRSPVAAKDADALCRPRHRSRCKSRTGADGHHDTIEMARLNAREWERDFRQRYARKKDGRPEAVEAGSEKLKEARWSSRDTCPARHRRGDVRGTLSPSSSDVLDDSCAAPRKAITSSCCFSDPGTTLEGKGSIGSEAEEMSGIGGRARWCG